MPRIAVEHVDASRGLPELMRQERETLIVFWWNDIPVGQVYDTGPQASPIDLARHWGILASGRALIRAKELIAQAPTPKLDASLVICTRDRPDELRRCLASFPDQSHPPREVIVVDNASRDGRTRVVAEAAGVTYVREDRPGLDIARNTGVRHAHSDVIAFTDDDVRLHRRWLERLVTGLQESDAMAVTGLVLPAELDTEAQQIFEKHWGFGRGYDPIEFGQAFFASDRRTGAEVWKIGAGASMAFRRQAFEAAGLFDERLDVGAAGCSGDSEFWHRILSVGGTCRYEPTSVAFHYHRRDIDGLASQIHHYMKGHTAALLVQYERTGHWGNLWRIFVALPGYYAVRALRRIWRGIRPDNRLLKNEVTGFIAGIIYYLRHRRTAPQ